jgi:hypothetical protein
VKQEFQMWLWRKCLPYTSWNRICALRRGHSSTDFDCCAGAIDGVLIWIHKPSIKDCIKSRCNSGKFFCGREEVRTHLSSSVWRAWPNSWFINCLSWLILGWLFRSWKTTKY